MNIRKRKTSKHSFAKFLLFLYTTIKFPKMFKIIRRVKNLENSIGNKIEERVTVKELVSTIPIGKRK